MHDQQNDGQALSRRDFLKSSSILAAGAAVAGSFPSIASAEGTKKINAIVIGFGGRGGGAARNFMDACKVAGVEGKIVAVADIFPEQAARAQEAYGVPASKCFSGFDGYMKALEQPDVNYAILATPPGFRAIHFMACVKAGKNIFTEKPVAVDGRGCRLMYEAAELSKQKGLKVAAGTQRRHQADYIATVNQIKDGAIGDIVSLRAYWVNGGPIWHRGDHGDSELERQIRNWYHYIWLSGDHICEQHVHNLDVCNWLMNNQHPVRAWGMGARQQLGSKSGEIWDNFAVEFEYANGVRIHSYCGQIKRDFASVSEAVHGTKGTSNAKNMIKLFDGAIVAPPAAVATPAVLKPTRLEAPKAFGQAGMRKVAAAPAAPAEASSMWRYREKVVDPYMQEHVDLIHAIVNDTPLNEAAQVTDSTLTAIMGREAAYSGKQVDWDTVLNGKFSYLPEQVFTDLPGMTWGDFRTLQPPMPSMHDIFAEPPVVPLAAKA